MSILTLSELLAAFYGAESRNIMEFSCNIGADLRALHAECLGIGRTLDIPFDIEPPTWGTYDEEH